MIHRRCLAAALAAALACVLAAPAVAGTTTVPDCVGLDLEQATALLEQAGFQPKVVGVQGRPVGLVVSQVPGGLSQADASQAITLYAGAPTPKPGPTAEPTPEPAPQPAPQPDDDLPPAGSGGMPIQPGTETGPVPEQPSVPDEQPRTPPAKPEDAPPAGVAPGMPAPGALGWNGRALPPGRLPSEDGPELPSVLGQPVQAARTVLAGWQVNVEQTLAVPELVGKVVNQWPYAGQRVSQREVVTVVVAVAQRPSSEHRAVPQAQLHPWREGVSLVEAAGFVAEPVSVASSDAERGLVLAQVPQPGSLAIPGRGVRLFVGRGPVPYSADLGSQPGGDEPAPRQPDVPETPGSGTPAPDEDLPPAGTGTTPIQPGTDLPAPPPDKPSPVRPAPAQPKPDDDLPPAGSGNAPIEPGADRPAPKEPPAMPDAPPTGPVAPPTPEPVPEPTPPPPAEVPALPAPSLRTPEAGEAYPYKYGADFAWSEVSGAAGYELQLEVERPSGAWAEVSVTPVSGPRHRPATLESGRYRWRVRAVASDGSKGRWSDYRRLYMY